MDTYVLPPSYDRALQEATETVHRATVQEVPLPELPQRFRVEVHPEEAPAERVRHGAAVQVPLLLLSREVEVQHTQAHQPDAQGLHRLRDRHLELAPTPE